MDYNRKSLLLSKQHHIELSGNDRRQNMLITGVPSTGVTMFAIELIMQDLSNNLPVVVLDPYGGICEEILQYATEEQLQKTAYIDIGNKGYPVGLNIFQAENADEKREIANTVINLLYSLYDPNRTGIIGPRFDHAVRNAIATILYEEKSTFFELVRCLTDSEYVHKILPNVTDPMVKNYWEKQIAQTSDFHKSEVLDYIVSKFGRFVTDPRIRNIVCQSDSNLNFVELLKSKHIILLDFSSFHNDPEAMKVISEIVLLQLSYAIKKIDDGNPAVSLYIDEVCDFPANTLVDLLRTGRKYKLNLTLITQRISDAESRVQKELLRIGTLISFRVSTVDAVVLAPEFHNTITIDHLSMLKKFHVAIKTLKEGNPVIYEQVDNTNNRYENKSNTGRDIEKIKQENAKIFGKPVSEVAEAINARML